MITEVDIKNSLSRLQDAFEGRYGHFPIQEGTRRVGMLTLDKKQKKIFVTFRGSMNSHFEVFSCLFIWKKRVNELPAGNAHAGIYSAFQKTQRSFKKSLEAILQANNTSLERFDFVVDGYSRGSGLALLTALFLKQEYPCHTVDVFTYSTMRIFDEIGAHCCQTFLERRHWSFLCKEDLFPQWIGPPCLGFCPVGKEISFHATESSEYKRRVQENRYSYLAPIPLISWIIKKMISSASWEAHMPTIYNELSTTGTQRTQRIEKGNMIVHTNL